MRSRSLSRLGGTYLLRMNQQGIFEIASRFFFIQASCRNTPTPDWDKLSLKLQPK
jgi:hypothetical protein